MLNTSNGSTEPTRFQEDLLKFPPRLRKLALFISQSPKCMSIPEYCRACGMSYDSIKQGISRARGKGNDFNELVNHLAYQKFTSQKSRMYQEVIDKALKGSFRHLQLYFHLCGDLKEAKNEATTTVNNLCFVLPMPQSIENQPKVEQPAIPEHNSGEDHGVIDVESVRDTEETVLPKFEIHQCPFCGDSFETLELFGGHLTGEHERG